MCVCDTKESRADLIKREMKNWDPTSSSFLWQSLSHRTRRDQTPVCKPPIYKAILISSILIPSAFWHGRPVPSLWAPQHPKYRIQGVEEEEQPLPGTCRGGPVLMLEDLGSSPRRVSFCNHVASLPSAALPSPTQEWNTWLRSILQVKLSRHLN